MRLLPREGKKLPGPLSCIVLFGDDLLPRALLQGTYCQWAWRLRTVLVTMQLPFSFAHKLHNAESVLLSFAQHGSEPGITRPKMVTHMFISASSCLTVIFIFFWLPTDRLDLDRFVLSITGSHDEIIEH